MSDKNANEITLPFSRPFTVARAAAVPFEMRIDVEGDELERLAGFLEVDAVTSLSADLRITPWRREGVRVRGEVRAHVVQSCVVTLEPIETDFSEPVDATYLPENSRQFKRKINAEGELLVDPEGPDDPEPFTGSDIDLAAVVIEMLGLAIDPYPRKPDAELPSEVIDEDDGEDAVADRGSPFAALKDWKGGGSK
ncbi:DUF177 domain-containing protein [uncultured Martelella sp.]|uniref:YceD family protein n=1 Tax=uncultured Martelella sp. TaxID=392331 RepID=UPI0029C6A765|nr:DUF177 domain-containing protein [uncultured Martelella sp.]